jgi:ABC-type sugar transport system ATPase subunit
MTTTLYPAAPGESPLTGPAIEAAGLSKAFGNVVALDDMSFEVPAGSVLANG